MDTFGYLAVLFSIIIGLALTELLQSIRGLILARHRVTIFWPSVMRAGLLTLVVVQVWWAVFELRAVEEWTFGKYAFVLLHVVLLYLATALALPNPTDGEPVNMRTAYYGDLRALCLLLLGTVAVSIAKTYVLYGRFTNPTDLAFHGGFASITVVSYFSKDDRVHLVLQAVLLAVFLAYVATLFNHVP